MYIIAIDCELKNLLLNNFNVTPKVVTDTT